MIFKTHHFVPYKFQGFFFFSSSLYPCLVFLGEHFMLPLFPKRLRKLLWGSYVAPMLQLWIFSSHDLCPSLLSWDFARWLKWVPLPWGVLWGWVLSYQLHVSLRPAQCLLHSRYSWCTVAQFSLPFVMLQGRNKWGFHALILSRS